MKQKKTYFPVKLSAHLPPQHFHTYSYNKETALATANRRRRRNFDRRIRRCCCYYYYSSSSSEASFSSPSAFPYHLSFGHWSSFPLTYRVRDPVIAAFSYYRLFVRTLVILNDGRLINSRPRLFVAVSVSRRP